MSGKQDDKDKMNSRIYNLFFQYLVALLLTGDKETQFDVEVQRLSFDEKPLLRANFQMLKLWRLLKKGGSPIGVAFDLNANFKKAGSYKGQVLSSYFLFLLSEREQKAQILKLVNDQAMQAVVSGQNAYVRPGLNWLKTTLKLEQNDLPLLEQDPTEGLLFDTQKPFYLLLKPIKHRDQSDEEHKQELLESINSQNFSKSFRIQARQTSDNSKIHPRKPGYRDMFQKRLIPINS